MNAEKLLKLADGLENYVQDEWWRYETWFTSGFPEKVCGSAACAIGWAPQLMGDPNLKYVKDEFGSYDIVLDGFDGIMYCTIIAKYFDIPVWHAGYIFENEATYNQAKLRDVTRQDVAKCIRDYVKRHRDNPDIRYGYDNIDF